MDEATRADWQAMVADGEDYLLEDYQGSLAWLDTLEAEPGDLSPESIGCWSWRSEMVSRPGRGYVDDCLALVRPWGFDIGDIAAPTGDAGPQDSSVPAALGMAGAAAATRRAGLGRRWTLRPTR